MQTSIVVFTEDTISMTHQQHVPPTRRGVDSFRYARLLRSIINFKELNHV